MYPEVLNDLGRNMKNVKYLFFRLTYNDNLRKEIFVKIDLCK